MDLRILRLSPFDEAHDLGGELVPALGSPLTRQQSREALPGKRGLGLIERGTGHPKECGGLGLGGALVQHLAQHLVLDLHQVLSVEEGAALKPGGPHPLRVAVQAAECLEALGFGSALGHKDRSNTEHVILYTPLYDKY